eukprot:EG_transcript_3756
MCERDLVSVHDLQVYCEIGFSAHEIGKLQELKLTINILTDMRSVTTTDDITNGFDLKRFTKAVLKMVHNKRYNLIESVADDVARVALSLPSSQGVEVIIRKPNAIRFAASSGCRMFRQPKDFAPFKVVILIGSDVNPEASIPQGLLHLHNDVGPITRISKAYLTPGLGEAAGDYFVNLAVELHTYLVFNSGLLKDALRAIEDRLGRVRDPNNPNGPRPIDLDVVHVTGGAVRHQFLDAKALQDAHAAIPVAQLVPEAVCPGQKGAPGRTLMQVCRNITQLEDPFTFFKEFPLNLPPLLPPTQETGPAARRFAQLTAPLGPSTPGPAAPSQISMAAPPSTAKPSPSHSAGSPMATVGSSASSDSSTATHAPAQRCAVVTGGGSKLGTVITAALHAAGYAVAVHTTQSPSRVDRFVAKLNALRPNSAIAVVADFQQAPDEAAKAVVQRAVATFGRIDVVVNNAAIFEPTDLSTLQGADWTRQMNVNVAAPLFLVQHALPHLQAQRGQVVNVCDIHGDRPLQGHVVYSVSKAGLIALTKALAKDLGPVGVRVNGVSPGAISWITGKHDEAAKAAILSRIPLGSLGSPEAVAGAVLFLLRNTYMAGQVVRIDGGRSLGQ